MPFNVGHSPQGYCKSHEAGAKNRLDGRRHRNGITGSVDTNSVAYKLAALALFATNENIQDIVAGRDPKLPDPHEDAVYKFGAALAGGKKLSDPEFAAIEKALGRNGVAEVLVLLGYYTSVALAMKVHDVPVVKA